MLVRAWKKSVIRKKKTTRRIHLTLTKMSLIKKIIENVDREVEKLEFKKYLFLAALSLSCSTQRKRKVKSLSHVRLFATPWSVAYQAPLSMGFSRQDYWSGVPFPPPGDLPHPAIEPRSLMFPASAGRFFITGTTWETYLWNVTWQ